ncbi:MAG: TIGR01548 family HAD-type hydrolase, partial [Halobacteriaceae archaeon]
MDIEAVVLDIDGVLVDVENSYRRAIRETLDRILDKTISNEAIQEFKNAGGFNDDWELTDAAALYLLASEMGYGKTIDQYTAAISDRGGGLRGAKAAIRRELSDDAINRVLDRWDPNE